MNKKELSQAIISILNDHFPNPEIPLTYNDPYTLLIAVLLSAQCTDAKVNLVTPQLFNKANTPEKMIELKVNQIEEMIRPCGLAPTKSKAIWNLSKQLIDNHAGLIPQSFEELENLPGVGHKTASVVMAQAFNIPAFPVDTHIHRCANRWHLSKARTVNQTEADLKQLFPKELWIKLHLQMILFARKYCPAKGHKIEECPICRII